MQRLIPLVLATALMGPAAFAAQPVASIAVNCGADAVTAARETPNLHGNWDFLMDVDGTPSFGLLSIGLIDGGYGGSLTPTRTAPVVLRGITVKGDTVRMVVASGEGDVVFDGRLSAKGDRMCGIVTYHNGRTFPMAAQKRPSGYPSPPQAPPAR